MKKGFFVAALVAALAATAAAFGGTTAPGKSGQAAGPNSADTALIRCGRTRTIGVAAPTTGPAASIGAQQARWARFFVTRWNARRANRRKRLRIVNGDTQLPDTAQAIQVAERFASNGQILAVVGPAGSQEVQVTSRTFMRAGLAFVSGSATRTSLTTDRTRRGFFFRTVPNDDQQGPRVAQHILRVLNARRIVVVDAQNSYSTGLSDVVQARLRAGGATVQRESVNEETTTDFGSLIARIPRDTQVVYVPWQLAPKAQLFGQQLRASGRTARLFGSDGLFDPDTFRIAGSLVSFFPIDLRDPVIAAYRRGPGGGESQLFGLPSYSATQVVANAIDRSCRNGSATRREVRLNIARTVILQRNSLLGFTQRFVTGRGTFPLGPGDMQRPADFGIYRIEANGNYVRVA
jgi:branched-chain amino acid transport system substrate-binding protein